MKNQSPRLFLRFVTAIAAGSMFMHNACQDEKTEGSPPVIRFAEDVLSVTEGDDVAITMMLDKPAPGTSSMEVTIETNAIYGQHYTTNPAVKGSSIVFVVYKGQKSATATLKTVPNAKFEGAMFIVFQMDNSTDAFRLGAITTLTLVIGDDEGPSVINFARPSATANEKEASGFLVEIPFSAPAKGEGSLTVTLQPGKAVPGTNFSIDREVTDNTLSLNVVKNSTGVSFKVFPVDNDQFNGNFILGFSIADVSGVLQKGSAATFSLTVVDDEAPSIAKFALLSGSINESNGDGIVVEIPLSSPVKGEGTLSVAMVSQNLIYGTDFTTVPALENNTMTLELLHEQSSASFIVLPINDQTLGDDELLTLSIQEASGVVWKGSDSLTYELTIVDDEEPSIANFSLPSAMIDEIGADGMEIEILLSHPAPAPGTIVVRVARYYYNFTSDPEGEEVAQPDRNAYEITLNVPQNSERVSFRIFELENTGYRDWCREDGLTPFTIATVTGGIEKGDNETFNLTIMNQMSAMVGFQETEATVNENDAAGKEVIINFLRPPTVDGSLIVSADNYYLQRYDSDPVMYYLPMWGDVVNLNFQAGDNSVGFKVVPRNDNVAEASLVETFRLWSSLDGCVRIPGASASGGDTPATLTFVDDD